MSLQLDHLVLDIARCMKRIDEREPQAANARTGALFQPGIGPHPETQVLQLIARELSTLDAGLYSERVTLNVPYPGETRQTCDLCVGRLPTWDWVVEIKMLRLMGDNGKQNDNMLMHILSPYPADRSALTDCVKLVQSGFFGRRVVIIYGFDYPSLPMDPAIEAFELVAGAKATLSQRSAFPYDGLVHPVHQRGRVFGSEITALRAVM